MSTTKVKTFGGLRAKYNHNYRELHVSNADPTMADRNEELVRLPVTEAGNRKPYDQVVRERLAELGYHARRGQVLGVEVMTTFSPSATLDLGKWKQKNVEWLQKTFNVAKDGRPNVVSVMYHGDEVGNVHCHAFVIPIDEAGHLNASRFLDGSRALAGLQSSYAKDMEEFGLSRGISGSSAKHKQIRKFYAELNNALSVPRPEQGEDADAYRMRILGDIEEQKAALYRKQEEGRIRMVRELDMERAQMKAALRDEFAAVSRSTGHGMAALEEQRKETARYVNAAHVRLGELEKEVRALEEDVRALGCTPQGAREKIRFADNFRQRFRILQERDPQAAERLTGILQQMNGYDLEKGVER